MNKIARTLSCPSLPSNAEVSNIHLSVLGFEIFCLNLNHLISLYKRKGEGGGAKS
jgi:hypothetical protein